jgi:uncharacterized protein (DUF952 family)
MDYVYKVCDQSLWNQAVDAGVFVGAEIDLKDGYIHFSTAKQLGETLALHFAGRDALVLLTIDTAAVDLTWEPARNGDLFPHLYGALPLSAVRAVLPLERAKNGSHKLPIQF